MGYLMMPRFDKLFTKIILQVLFVFLISIANLSHSESKRLPVQGNFGLPGIIDLPTALRYPDGQIIFTQQLHKSLARSGIYFQALPRLGFSFRYSGHGAGGTEAYGRINHDRSFDAHLALFDESIYLPAISIGLRDFVGTGWYSSEYLVATKTLGNWEVTAGIGFGRLSGRNSFSNPLKVVSSKFENRDRRNYGKGGTLGNLNWFRGDASTFYGLNYNLGQKFTLSAEYTSDLMLNESSYLNIKSPWNYGFKYKLNSFTTVAIENLHNNQISLTASVALNPDKPPVKGGKDLAPVPMRLRGQGSSTVVETNEAIIRKVLEVDKFKIHHLKFEGDLVEISVTNTKFRTTSQAVGRLASTLQRFSSDSIKVAEISFESLGIHVATFRIELDKVYSEQFDPPSYPNPSPSIEVIETKPLYHSKISQRLSWGVGPYFAHRLFNPDLPLSMEVGLEIQSGYQLSQGLKIAGSVRKSAITNLTQNKRRSNSVLPRVHSDWPLYDFAGQSGHIHNLKLSYLKNLTSGFYFRTQAGLLEPFYAGIGVEILYKPEKLPFAIGLDIHRVRKRDYDMLFDLLDYQTTVGHLSMYYDAGKMFEIEVNAGKYLAGDWGVTTTISRKFGSGWEVGGYATLTDVPFETFGEGSFDKAIYVSIPIDWIIASPNKAKRRLNLRPITRDGGANLASARLLYRLIEEAQNSQFKRDYGRLWK